MNHCIVKVQPVDEECMYQEPERAHDTDAGFDIRTNIREDVVLNPGEVRLFGTGLRMAISPGYYGKVEARSGLARRHGLMCPCGVIDSGYRGELGVVLYNGGNDAVIIGAGSKIAQIVFLELPYVKMDFSDNPDRDLDPSSRGEDGFGSTGF